MKISMGSDGRLPVVEATINYLEEKGHQVIWHGPASAEEGFAPYPNVARDVAKDVAEGRADDGIVFCWTGTGVTISANKVKGIRAALCEDAVTAKGARHWNNANVLTMSMRRISEQMAREVVDAWLENSYQLGDHEGTDQALEQLYELDENR